MRFFEDHVLGHIDFDRLGRDAEQDDVTAVANDLEGCRDRGRGSAHFKDDVDTVAAVSP